MLRPPGTLVPRITLLVVLTVITLLALAVKVEVWPDPALVPPTGAKARLLVQQGKAGPGPDEENAPSPQEECPDAEVVREHLATGGLETDLFEVGTDRFIVSYEILERPQEKGLPSLSATVEDEDGRIISSGEIPHPQPGDPVRKDLTPNTGRTIVDAEPGSYRLDIPPSKPDRRYALLVEECGVPEVS